MPDQNGRSSRAVNSSGDPAGAPARAGVFDPVFARAPAAGGLFADASFAGGRAVADEAAWLRSMLAAEAALARALERAGIAPEGEGAAGDKAAGVEAFESGGH